MVYEIRDIVFVENYKYSDEEFGSKHIFVIVDKDNKAIDIDYYGFLMSSKIEKIGDKFPFNVPIDKNDINKLRQNSIVKCDHYIKLDNNEIKFKIGEITENDLKIFYAKYEEYLKLKSNMSNKENKKENNIFSEEIKNIEKKSFESTVKSRNEELNEELNNNEKNGNKKGNNNSKDDNDIPK